MKPATMGNRVRVGILLTMFVGAMLILVMSHATPSLAAGPTAPSFEANSYEFSVDENTAPDTLVQSVAATDLDGDSPTYSVGGTDAAQFNEVFALNTSTGEITVKTGASINYESAEPTSYRVNVMATDGEDDSGATQSQPTTDATATVVIEIVNVDEPGIVTLSTSSPQLGVGLSATLSDPDGRRGGIYNSWWSRANNADGPFFLTADDYYENYRSTTYTPKEADKYLYVKFTIQYFDRTCTRVSTRPGITNRCIKTAERVSASRVADEEGLIVQQQVSNTPATGQVTVTPTSDLQVGYHLNAKTRNIRDEDGTQSLRNHLTIFHWRWYRIDPVTAVETQVPSWVHGGWYTWVYVIKDADRGKGIQARVSFLDDYGNTETLRGPLIPIPAPPNNVATGSPVITGTTQVGETLSADLSGVSDADTIVTSTLTYLWYANDGADDTAIEGATDSTYTPVADDVGKTITVQVIFTDGFGYNEVVTSAPTAAVTAATENTDRGAPTETVKVETDKVESNSQATGVPIITGTAQVGETLTAATTGIADSNGLSNATFGYQWLADDAELSGATSSSYTLVAADKGKAIKVRVSFTDDGGNDESLTSAATDTVDLPLTASVHNVPTYHNGQSSFTFELRFGEYPKSDLSYRSVRDHAFTVTGGSVTYVRRLEPGSNVRWEITVTPSISNTVYLALNATTDCSAQGAICTERGRKLFGRLQLAVAGPNSPPPGTPNTPPPPNTPATGLPTITGATQVGETLTADTTGISDGDGLDNAAFAYQWLADDVEINGATASTYTLADADEGKAIKVKVTFTDAADNDEELTSAGTGAVAAAPPPPNTPATGLPSITGTAQVGETLTADATGISDGDGLDNATFTYQWLADDAEINGATASTYTLADADAGKAIKVRVSFTDDAENDEELTSAATGAVAAAPPPPNTLATGLPSITGTAQVGENLTADATGISDGDGLDNATFTYQWLADDAEINGATASTYTLADADEGKAITVRVSFTDDADNDEQLTSAGTGAVAAAPPPPNTPATGLPAITGTAQVGETLTAGTTGISDGDGLDNAAFAYQWLADDVEINGATGSTYTLADADEGKAIKVRVSFTDDAENDEQLTSAGTGAVAAAPPPPNTPATGLPAISGTAQVGETLTAGTTGITDGDGLGNAAFAYQWLADDAEINGATGSTYTLADADEGKAIKVRVSFTDDAENGEVVTSAATGTVAAAVVMQPLTASTQSVPSSHDGSATFIFELRFSEELVSDFSYVAMRDHVLTVAGGSVTYVRRLGPPSNIGWEIHVTPDSDGALIIVLPVTGDCGSDGAICTEDGRRLSNRLQFTVNGP